jgi:regulator of replication initiation timing
MRQYIPQVFIVILLISVIFQCTDQISLTEQVATEKQKVKGFEKEIKVLNTNVKILNIEKDSLNIKVKNLDLELSNRKKEIINIQKKKDEKINVINSYNAGQLQQFFTERYPK